MKGFLENIAEQLILQHGRDMGKVSVIFPNRRAGLYLKSLIKSRVQGPAWSPYIMSFQDLVQQQVKQTLPDPLTLIFELHKVYNRIMQTSESFEDFYYWGQMLLKDYDEVDKYLVNPRVLYSDLSKQKELDMVFDYLTSEQKELIRQFWRGFDEKESKSKTKFLDVWRNLYAIYESYNRQLAESGMAYEGAMYRKMAENLEEIEPPSAITWFAGFNALTGTEEKIIQYFVENFDTQIFWDLDAYYYEDKNQEAGRFLREYSKKGVFRSSFPTVIPNAIRGNNKDVQIIGVPQFVGQAKTCAVALNDYIERNPHQDWRRVAIILAEETLLMPMLHSLPSQIDKINVTMGFPLMFAPLSGLIEEIIQLAELKKESEGKIMFHHRPAMALLGHPLIRNHTDTSLLSEMEKHPRLYWLQEELQKDTLTGLLFANPQDFVRYLIDFLEELATLEEVDSIENSYLHYYLSHLVRYQELINGEITVEMFRRLFRQLVRVDKVPFTGEPLEGIQIMGVLETRNLDFDVIFVLGMNEEAFPGGKNQHSYIPYNLRKAYNLPHYDQQDAMYAYLFYRLFHTTREARLYYNTEGNDLGGEEMSRFLKQLIYENPFPVHQKVLSNIPLIKPLRGIALQARPGDLEEYLEGGARKITPSAINVFLDCGLKFYFRYIARIYLKDELEDTLDARTLGSLVHYCIESMYKPYVGKEITEATVDRLIKKIDDFIEEAFKKEYKVEGETTYRPEGKNVIARDVAERFVKNILERDAQYAPFRLLGIEEEYILQFPVRNVGNVQLGGSIDRIDEKDGVIRILDLKTGKDKLEFGGLEHAFQRKNRSKVALQTFFYSLLYPDDQSRLIPAVYNKNVLFQDENWQLMDRNLKSIVSDFGTYRDAYREKLEELLTEIFSSGHTFDQVEDVKMCARCDYNVICQRG